MIKLLIFIISELFNKFARIIQFDFSELGDLRHFRLVSMVNNRKLYLENKNSHPFEVAVLR